jgi:hypothetical protein
MSVPEQFFSLPLELQYQIITHLNQTDRNEFASRGDREARIVHEVDRHERAVEEHREQPDDAVAALHKYLSDLSR